MPRTQVNALFRTFITAAIVSLAAAGNVGFFRINCGAILHGRVDPIISPGSIAGHVHKISGGYNIGLNSSYADMRNSKCTSCEVTSDLSAYWTPLLYYQFPNGSFINVPSGGHLVYYLGRGDNIANVKPFPAGFKMLSGNSTARTYDNTTTWNGARKIADRVSFVCLDSSASYQATPNLVNTNCSYAMRAQIQFQSCWDGVNLYKSDQSHVAYLSSIDNGACPSTHPVLLPHLFFEVYYYPNNIAQVAGGRFVFANGDTTGYGFHGDFLNGWDPTVLQSAVTQCIAGNNPSGNVGDCAPLKPVDSTEYTYNCPERPPLINEPTLGLISSLPGCNPTSPLVKCMPSNPPSLNAFTPSKASDTPTIPPVGKSYSGGWTYRGSVGEPTNQRALKGASTSGVTMTTDLCLSYCGGKGFKLAGTEYGRECYCDNSLQNGATLNTTGGSTTLNSMICAGNSSQFCGGPSRLMLYGHS